MKMSPWTPFKTRRGLTPPAKSRMSSDLEENRQRICCDVSEEAGLDAVLVMRSGQTDGAFIRARSFRNQVELTWNLAVLCTPS